MKKSLPIKTGLIALASLTLAGSAVAQPPAAPGAGHGRAHAGFGLLQFDTNADGKLTRAEFDAAQKARFTAIDANKDGTATREEFMASMKARMDQRKTEDGKERFKALDSNGDGQISSNEFAARQDRTDGHGGFRHGGHGGPRGRHHGSRMGDHRADADNNGSVTLAEFSARGVEAFTAADTNKDGTVTIAELQAMRPASR